MANQVQIADLNKKHSLAITEKLSQIEVQRKNNEVATKQLNAQHEQERAELQLTLDELDIFNKDLDKKNKSLDSQLLAAKAIITVKEDVEKQMALVVEHNKQIDEAKDGLNKELENASEYISRLEQKFYESKTQSLELLKSLKNAENEIEVLKAYVIDLKSRIAVYIPVKGD